ncbi:Arginine permease [Tolypocladium ophioglossoides CBS 100239]|uniref:Arginine permease n=1 Tax=Tolypocladium ophioglossoides (strain CBS 100239) TaxID=1163406 RepID=A0A0L0NGA3_TOLOC|nr:Arginine permease [Tolypocladium ophioglossoides CBS 100239]
MENPSSPSWMPDWIARVVHQQPGPVEASIPIDQLHPVPDSPEPPIITPTTSSRDLSQSATRRRTHCQATSQPISITNMNQSNRNSNMDQSSLDDPNKDNSSLGGRGDSENPCIANQKNVTRREKNFLVTPSRSRLVHRKLRGTQLLMPAVNATLGMGLYWRGGEVLELGGPLSVLLSFLLPGLLAWAVMQCITEMLCIWPIPGALSVYVSEFVDDELGIAVGVAYWFISARLMLTQHRFTYSISFSALIATSAAEIHFWINGNKAFDGGVVYFLIPLVLIYLNSFRVDIYGWFEVVSGSIKILCLLVVVCAMVAINAGEIDHGICRLAEADRIRHVFGDGVVQRLAVRHFPTVIELAFLLTQSSMCLSISTYAYVGVEVVAASAFEARWPKKSMDNPDTSQQSDRSLLIGQTVKSTSVYIPVLATIAYVLAGVLASFNIRQDDCRLPRLSWFQGNTTSVFVAIAMDSKIPALKDIFNVFHVFTALTRASTNLYVASRALFGLTTRLDGSSGQPLYLRFLAWFGKTNSSKVPMRAMIVSAMAFCWVPFLQLNGLIKFIEILTTMGSDGVILVWACECWAFIRYYHCIHRHRAFLEHHKVSQVRRWDQVDHNDYPYRSHLQPVLAYLALAGCLFILVVSNSALLWNRFHPTPFLSTFLLQFVFIILWAVLKVVREAKWSLVDLDDADRVVKKIRNLHDIRLGAS